MSELQHAANMPAAGTTGSAGHPVHLELRNLRAGYGQMEVIHGVDLKVDRGQSVCLVGPNGAGKSTVLNAIFGLADLLGGRILVAGHDTMAWSPKTMITQGKIAYVLQSNSAFADMTVEENLLVGGHLLPSRRHAVEAAERMFDSYPRLARHRGTAAGALSGGERRILEFSRALITDPDILLVDEPSIGLEPRAIDEVFEMLGGLQRIAGKTIIVVEQNVKKGLEFADIGCVLVSGRVMLTDRAAALLHNPQIAELFLGG